jgi:hypothetical protein
MITGRPLAVNDEEEDDDSVGKPPCSSVCSSKTVFCNKSVRSPSPELGSTTLERNDEELVGSGGGGSER